MYNISSIILDVQYYRIIHTIIKIIFLDVQCSSITISVQYYSITLAVH